MVLEVLVKFLPFLGTTAFTVLVLFLVHRFILRGHDPVSGKRFQQQLIMSGLTLIAGVVVITVLPITDTLKAQLLSLYGILLSAAIALSSTTLLSNAMAGIMIRIVRAFRLGEFIKVGNHFGRVSEMGLFHTEIQTEDRDLLTLPNMLLVTNAVKRIRPSGTILSAGISLGYDVPRAKVESLLLQAAEKSGLKEAFVRIIALDDHAVGYKVAGLLKEVKQLLAVRSDLRGRMLDTLHEAGIEIVSPQFRNQRNLTEDTKFIPVPEEIIDPVDHKPPVHGLVFDKAEEAATLEILIENYETLKKRINQARANAIDKAELERLEQRMERLKDLITERQSQSDKEE